MKHIWVSMVLVFFSGSLPALAGQSPQAQLRALYDAARKHQVKGDDATAVEIMQKVLRDGPRVWGEGSMNHGRAMSFLGQLYYAQGVYTKAELLFRHSLEISEAKLGKDHPETATCLNDLGQIFRKIGQYAKAERVYHRCLEIREVKLGKDHPDTASTLNEIGLLCTDMGQFAKAELLHQRSLEIWETKYGKDSQYTAIALNNLAFVYQKMVQYAKAEILYQRSLEIREAKFGKAHLDTATVLNNLSNLYHEMGQYAKAERMCRRVLDIQEANLGNDHPLIVYGLNNLANIYRDMGHYNRAEPLYFRSLEIRKAKLGKDHPDTATILNNLAWSSASQKKWGQAAARVQESRQGVANHLAHLLPVLSEQAQLTLLETTFEQAFHRALSLGLVAPNDAGIASAEWLVNGKALTHQSLAQLYLLARASEAPLTRQLVESLQNTRSELAALINRESRSAIDKNHQERMQDLRIRENDLAQELARAVGRPYRANPWVLLDDVRGKLGPKSAFVDIARFPVFDFAANKSMGLRYVAWITPPQGKGDIQLIDLGEGEPIDQLVEQTRKTLLDASKSEKFLTSVKAIGEAEALNILTKPLQELSAKVLHPLLPTLEKYEEWIICPDGALWLTPWAALLLKDGKFAVEQHLIRHVVSGRDLVLELTKTKAESAFIFADPDYDLTPTKALVASGIRGASGIVGQRLRGTIGTWNVSFEFLDNEAIIRDEDNKGVIVGKATWKQQGDTLTMQTAISKFTATTNAGDFRGERTKRNDDGTLTRDIFRMELPRGIDEEKRSVGSAHRIIPKVFRLPGTALEAEAIRPKLEQWLGQKPKVYLEGQASETLIKSIKNPRVLVLATHGYFLPTQEVETKNRPSFDFGDNKRLGILIDKKGQPIENPLLRCGLLLAGCNKRAEAKPGEDDGILTGLEIVGMNLQGCELVVLSACETGLGDVRNGEGVAGLRQAFQLAGAKGVLASLWQVPDRETALLMNAFYGELAKGKSQAEALRQAQLERIEARRRQFGAAHPFFWAAFTLTNRGTE